MSMFDLLRSDGSIVVNKKLARSIGLDAAILYSELLSWHYYYEKENKLDDNGSFYKIAKDLTEYTTLSQRLQRNAVKVLEEKGLIETEIKGMPAQRYFKIITDEFLLLQLLKNEVACSDKIEYQVTKESVEQATQKRKLSNNKEILNKNTKKKSITNVTQQNTLISIPKQEPIANGKLTRRDKSLAKINVAIQSNDWSKIKPTDFVYYFEMKHNELMIEPISVPVSKTAGFVVAQFRNNFIQRYDLKSERVCEYIDAFINEYKNNPQVDTKYSGKIDWDTFNLPWLLDKFMPAIQRKLTPVERRFNTSEKVVEHREFDDDEVF